MMLLQSAIIFSLLLYLVPNPIQPALATECAADASKETLAHRDAKLVRRIDFPGMVAPQGVHVNHTPSGLRFVLAHGYGDTNASLFAEDGDLLVTRKFSNQDEASPLLSSVIEVSKKFVFGDYRAAELVVTDRDLSVERRINLGVNGGFVLGMTAAEPNIVYVPISQSGFVLQKVDITKGTIQNFTITGMEHEPYDIDLWDGCLFIVNSVQASIWTIPLSELQSAKRPSALSSFISTLVNSEPASHFPRLRPREWVTNLEKPQHAGFWGNYYFVLETDAFRVRRIDRQTGKQALIRLPVNQIFRGMAIVDENEFILTGFDATHGFGKELEHEMGIYHFKF